MRVITITGLSLQFDADQITQGSRDDQAQQAVELVNLSLQREPFGLGAQLITPREFTNAEMTETDDAKLT